MPFPRKLTGTAWVEAANLRAAGWTYAALAAKYGMTSSGVRLALLRESTRQEARCGRLSGYGLHLQRGERPCPACCDANARKQREWRERRGSGSAPAAEARQHLTRWVSTGMSIPQISRATGVSMSALYTIRRGAYGSVQLRTLQALRDTPLPGQEAA